MFFKTFVVVTCLLSYVLSDPIIHKYHTFNDIIPSEEILTEVTTESSVVTEITSIEDDGDYSTTTEDDNDFSTTIEFTEDDGNFTTTTEYQESTTDNNSFDYCQICDFPGTHTLCKHPKCELSGNCTLVKQIPLNLHEKQLIVKYHNELRNKVARGTVDNQPSASNMQELEWDTELEYISQCWANQCQFEHDECRDLQNDYAGQNIVYHGSTLQTDTLQESLRSLIDDWFNEYVDLPNEYILSRPFNNPTFTNHYTQLVWAETNRIGCARVYAFEDPFYTVYLYCNYAPRGNDVNKPIYITGLPATDCHKYGLKKSVNYSGLCQ